MALDLVNYEQKALEAVKAFWGNREAARQKQIESGKADQGERAGVTGGKNMDGFLSLVLDIVKANGLAHAEIHQNRAMLTLPGYFRSTKLWDLLVMYKGELIAAIELKSQVGPSFGNNFNNRTEEAIGTAHDLWTAYREGAFGKQPRPFVGWLIMVEDAPKSRSPVRDSSPHFSVFRRIQRGFVPQKVRFVMSATCARTAIHNGHCNSGRTKCCRIWKIFTTIVYDRPQVICNCICGSYSSGGGAT